jgi:DNA-binding transcriptional LysR family regulator
MRAADLDDVKLSELNTFVHVARSSSLSAAARELGVTPSQVSKSLARLESRLRTKLLTRTARGVRLTEQGLKLLPKLQELSSILRGLGTRSTSETQTMTIAAPSYLASTVVPRLVEKTPTVRWRVQESGAALLRASMPEHAFEFALFFGHAEKPPAGWVGGPVGKIRNGLFARPSLAAQLGKGAVASSKLSDRQFVMPLRSSTVAVTPNDDGCPIPISERRVGTEVLTFAVGLEVAAHSEQLVFGHVFAAARFVQAGLLVEVPIKGWSNYDTVLLFSSETVLARVEREVRSAATAVLEAAAD